MKTQIALNIEIYQPKKWDYSSGKGILKTDGEPKERPSSAYSFEGDWSSESLRYAKDRYSTPFFAKHSVQTAIDYFTKNGYVIAKIVKIDNSNS